MAVLLLEEAEADLIQHEFAEGLAPSNATRALFEHEHRAKTRFADLEQDLDEAVEETVPPVEELHSVVRAAIMLALFGAAATSISPYKAVATIEKLTKTQPKVVQEAVEKAIASLAAVFENVYQTASVAVIGEAVRQGVDPKKVAPKVAPKKVFDVQAAGVAAHPWQRILGKIQAELTKPAALIKDEITVVEVQKVLDTIKIDGTRDLAKQTINTAAGTGRIDTALELEPDEIWASEILDGATCDHCAAVDGKDYASMDEARTDYPYGTYVECLGETRCRGTLVFIFADA